MAKEKFTRNGEAISNLVLISVENSKKISFIKVLKAQLDIGLTEAKALVDTAPQVLKEKVKAKDLLPLKTLLEEAGGVLDIVEPPTNKYTIVFESKGSASLSDIQDLMEKHFGFHLSEVVKILSSTPYTLKEDLFLERVERIVKEFESIGAIVSYYTIGIPISIENPDELYDVILNSYATGSKSKLIKAVKESTGLTVAASTNIVNQLPQKVLSGTTEAKAEEIKAVLEGAGGVVEIKLASDEEEPVIEEEPVVIDEIHHSFRLAHTMYTCAPAP